MSAKTQTQAFSRPRRCRFQDVHFAEWNGLLHGIFYGKRGRAIALVEVSQAYIRRWADEFEVRPFQEMEVCDILWVEEVRP